MRAFLVVAVLFAAAAEATSPPCDTVNCLIQRATPRYKRCYKQALERDSPTVSGKAVITITFRESGEVEKVGVDFPAASPLFTQCLREATLKSWFGGQASADEIVLPVVFDPGVPVK